MIKFATLKNKSDFSILIKNSGYQIPISPKGSTSVDKVVYDALESEIKDFMSRGILSIHIDEDYLLKVEKTVVLEEPKKEVKGKVVLEEVKKEVKVDKPRVKEEKVNLNLNKKEEK